MSHLPLLRTQQRIRFRFSEVVDSAQKLFNTASLQRIAQAGRRYCWGLEGSVSCQGLQPSTFDSNKKRLGPPRAKPSTRLLSHTTEAAVIGDRVFGIASTLICLFLDDRCLWREEGRSAKGCNLWSFPIQRTYTQHIILTSALRRTSRRSPPSPPLARIRREVLSRTA